MMQRRLAVALALVTVMAVSACAKKTPPVARPMDPPAAGDSAGRPPSPPEPVSEPTIVPPDPAFEDELSSRDLDEINRNSPFQPVFYGLDQAEVDAEGQRVLDQNAEILRKYPSWVITIEGHADERGTAEYNLALGERRALAARNYLVSLGIPANRLHIVSYGKEFPFDPDHNEAAWARNRRAHFVVTSK